MKIRFFEPPAEQKVGGLDAAIVSLRKALESLGHEVRVNGDTPARSDTDVVHFHGLWQRNFSALAKACVRENIPFVASPHGMLELMPASMIASPRPVDPTTLV